MAGARPSGTVTFLFTDIEGSTRLWEDHPDEMKAALARHDEILRSAIEAHDGYVFATGGDGFAAAFDMADAAADAAIDCQRELASAESAHDLPLRVRMGLHTGTADERDGDYFGQTPTRAARIMGAGWGGQILVSATTADLIRDHASLSALGAHVLRDLNQPEDLFQLSSEGLESGFPPPRSLDSYASNLPVQRTPFIGRANDISHVADHLRRWRIVTLTGVGGVGKTRLALQVAAEVLPAHEDGAWVTELASANDEESVATALGAALGIRPLNGMTMRQSCLSTLRRRDDLLVLDNCEHVLDEIADLIDDITATCPSVRILATSREGIGVEGEHLVAVRSLSVRTDGDLDESGEAVELFVDRARGRDETFELTSQNRTAVIQLCQRLDGIPLAIELAAARISAMTAAEILERMDERFVFLTGGRRRARGRHQTLRRAIDWSYDLLNEAEQELFRELAVFASGFDQEAADAVASQSGLELSNELQSLVEKSLIVPHKQNGTTLYGYLETIRQYAEERLEEADAVDDAMLRATEYYTTWARACADGLLSAEELQWTKRLDGQVPNIRRCFDWAVANERPELVVRLLAPFSSALFGAADRVGELCLEATDVPGTHTYVGSAAVFAAAAVHQAEIAAAESGLAMSYRAVEIRIATGDQSALPLWVHQVFLGAYEDSLEEAVEVALVAAGLARSQGERGALVGSLCGAATYGAPLGQPESVEYADEALREAAQSGSPTLRGIAAYSMAHAVRETDVDVALAVVTAARDELLHNSNLLRDILDYEVLGLMQRAGGQASLPDHAKDALGRMRSDLGRLTGLMCLVPNLVDDGHTHLAERITQRSRLVPQFNTIVREVRLRAEHALAAAGLPVPTEATVAEDIQALVDETLAWLESRATTDEQ